MIKVVGLFKRRHDITRQQFKDYWLKNHTELERRIFHGSLMTKIVASFVVEDVSEPEPFDGMVELYFESMDDVRRTFAGGDQVMRDDERNFCDPAFRIFVITEEHTIIARGDDPEQA